MFDIVLFEPEIPQNTGNIMRTCVGIGAKLHLIEPMGFKIDEAKLRRSALDYYEHLDYVVHPDWESFAAKHPGRYLFLSRYGQKTYTDIDFTVIKEPLYLVFGKESTGIDKQILARHIKDTYRIPTNDKIRSLNLSNAVAIVSFEILRQQGFPGLDPHEPDSLKGSRFLDQFITDEEGNNHEPT
ncbi:MAG: tRNA (cytidine(34)-2'-O)-methyltransferase [Acholeplasmataceae bacterium]|nr:MAG: tRNA (cytidine(34)-2'-O)-methyltransferase [Acholeplasmataceae bacterium]